MSLDNIHIQQYVLFFLIIVSFEIRNSKQCRSIFDQFSKLPSFFLPYVLFTWPGLLTVYLVLQERPVVAIE